MDNSYVNGDGVWFAVELINAGLAEEQNRSPPAWFSSQRSSDRLPHCSSWCFHHRWQFRQQAPGQGVSDEF